MFLLNPKIDDMSVSQIQWVWWDYAKLGYSLIDCGQNVIM